MSALHRSLSDTRDHGTAAPLFDWYGNGDVEGSFSDEERVFDLVPAVLCSGRPFFGTSGRAVPVLLADPRIVQGRRVTQLVHDVRR